MAAEGEQEKFGWRDFDWLTFQMQLGYISLGLSFLSSRSASRQGQINAALARAQSSYAQAAVDESLVAALGELAHQSASAQGFKPMSSQAYLLMQEDAAKASADRGILEMQGQVAAASAVAAAEQKSASILAEGTMAFAQTAAGEWGRQKKQHESGEAEESDDSWWSDWSLGMSGSRPFNQGAWPTLSSRNKARNTAGGRSNNGWSGGPRLA